MQCYGQRPYRAAYVAAYVDFFRINIARHRATLADDHLLTVDIAYDVTFDVKLILRDDLDLLAKNSEIVADYGNTGCREGTNREAF